MGRRLRIVVADDERDTREYFAFLLTRQGHDVREAADGPQLVEACREFRPDLIVTDYAMPGLDGLAAAAVVNREGPVPVVVISGRQDLDAAARSHGIRLVRVLTKPVKEADLATAVQSVAAERPEAAPAS
jgi:CheY-like chemotaxis protein